MPLIGWIFLIVTIVLVVGGLMILRDNARDMPISEDKMKRIRERKKEQEAKDKEEEW
ncbi:hypothetical protein RE428_42380 [Marinobacter nanhaiticus D15-8W]|uniref:DUF2897 family protein n=1 Tax=Marinobacter nanhaiticus D15-8W TaxID=626887 RepID=N6WWE7_9GAMM|nr:DUF2897 family protein [Marinobacter nanhaiticus]ENO15921.1 DUF2897 family protein [Marinobacter nanhaiticus D15-8W]BES73220.1 hypothetical protein RE428_42380 [Marinobacter nanhaiticus D15-8W]